MALRGNTAPTGPDQGSAQPGHSACSQQRQRKMDEWLPDGGGGQAQRMAEQLAQQQPGEAHCREASGRGVVEAAAEEAATITASHMAEDN